jgi:predicted MPP superfamily phosphohydrolase
VALSVVSAVVFVNTAAENTAGMIKKPIANVIGGLALTLILTKLVFSAVIFAGDIYRMGHLAVFNMGAFLNDSEYASGMIARNIHVAQVGLAVAVIPFLSFVHGITIGKYKYKIKRVKLIFPDLPEAFNGYKILQFSDMHAGSFDSLERVKKGIEKMQAEEADLILFTGDMVNNMADEVKPFVSMMSDLKAKDGKYSILGNHDYGDYIAWANKEAKIENLYRLINYQHEAGFHLLMNENITLKRGNESIRLAGVENWGKPPFPQHGDLKKALSGIKPEEFTVLMSHDPSHWDLEVLKTEKKIHLTLSGHTHGMQMGIDIPGLKWSPVKYKYPRWSGLYEELGRNLYVNNGFGFLGFPGRVGIYPEITVLELSSSN